MRVIERKIAFLIKSFSKISMLFKESRSVNLKSMIQSFDYKSRVSEREVGNLLGGIIQHGSCWFTTNKRVSTANLYPKHSTWSQCSGD